MVRVGLPVFAVVAGLATAPLAATYTFTETATGVSGVLSGSLNAPFQPRPPVGALVEEAPPPVFGVLDPGGAQVGSAGENAMADVYFNAFDNPPLTFGSGATTLASLVTGDFFLVDGANNQLSIGFGVDTSDLSQTLFFDGATFLSLGVAPGVYVFRLALEPADSLQPLSAAFQGAMLMDDPNAVIVNFESAVIPAPAALPLLAGALGLFGFLARRRRRA